ncbi:MAG TPA: VOC family protein [Micromonosporaceae bacterium]|nr:VOC family protein [Micromonosporaceae bacterium]
MTAIGDLIMINLDSPDPRAHATFYERALGWEVTHSDDQYAMISNGNTSIGFGRVEAYQPPQWPDTTSGKRYHLDLYVDDLAKAEEECLRAGASRPDFQPGGERWRVLTDPAGHPFCLCLRPQS